MVIFDILDDMLVEEIEDSGQFQNQPQQLLIKEGWPM